MASRLQDVIIRDTRANQPLATAVSAGTLYYVTDEGVTERSDGTNWESFSDTGVVASVIVSAGLSSASLNSIVFSNSNGVSFGLSNSTITASHNGLTSQSNQALSAANGSFTFQTAHFSNGSNVSFSTSAGSAIFGIVATSLTNINFSAGTTSNNLSNLVFSNSNNVSFGLDGSTVTATVTVATSLTNIRVSAGTTSNLLSSLVFSNSNGISFGIDGSTITASGGGGGAGATWDYFQNVPFVTDVRTNSVFLSRIWVEPFQLPAVMSANYLRFPLAILSLVNRTFGDTSANTSWSASQVNTWRIQLFTKGTGASSDSFFSTSAFTMGMTHLTQFTAGAVGSNYTASIQATLPLGTGVTNLATNYACTSQSYVINTANIGTLFNSTRWAEVPFNTTVPASAYWLGIARSYTSGNNGATGLSTTNFNFALVQMSMATTGIFRYGDTGPNLGYMYAQGSITTNAQTLGTTGFSYQQVVGSAAEGANIVPFMVI